MNFHPMRLTRLPLMIGMALVLAFSAGAQQGGEPIIFSSPDGGGVSSNLTRLSKPVDSPDTLSFTSPNFGSDLPSGRAPTIPNIPSGVSISEGRQLQNLLNPKKDWMLMTPGEIMGVTSPEKIFQVPERDAMGLRKNPSALENFLGRQSGAQATNGFSPDNPDSTWRFSGNRSFQADGSTPNSIGNNLSSIPSSLSELFNNTRQRSDNFSGPNAGANSWKSSGGSSPFLTSDSSQPTEMDQFRQLLGANPPTPPQTRSYSSGGPAFFSPQPTPNNNFSQPTVNPIGASYAPLTSGIGTPAALPTLPTITSQSSLQSVITPAWTPQTPPWMIQGPQPFVIPQRKF